MLAAIQEAQHAVSLGQYAIAAAVIGPHGEIISIEHATTFETHDATAHAEINAIRSACKTLSNRYLIDCWLYTTLEPCPMCTSAAIWAKMKGVVFGATKEDAQKLATNLRSEKLTWRQIDISSKEIIKKGDYKLDLTEGFMREECCKLFDITKNN